MTAVLHWLLTIVALWLALAALTWFGIEVASRQLADIGPENLPDPTPAEMHAWSIHAWAQLEGAAPRHLHEALGEDE